MQIQPQIHPSLTQQASGVQGQGLVLLKVLYYPAVQDAKVILKRKSVQSQCKIQEPPPLHLSKMYIFSTLSHFKTYFDVFLGYFELRQVKLHGKVKTVHVATDDIRLVYLPNITRQAQPTTTKNVCFMFFMHNRRKDVVYIFILSGCWTKYIFF